jgi:pimeloyl-ACP methyl ester carboxylesterase
VSVVAETRFAKLTEVTLAYEITGGGPHIVWAHGLGSSRAGDRDVIDALSEHFTVLSYDARGHAQSPPVTDEALYTYALLSRDLRELLDHVGWERTAMAGASMGAATEARVAMEEPDRVSSLVMARPGTSGTPTAERVQVLFRLAGEALRAGGWDAVLQFLTTIPETAEVAGDPQRVEALRDAWSLHDPASIAAALIGIPASAPLTQDVDPRAITAAVLVIPGNDLIHPREVGESVAKAIPSARIAAPFDGLPREQETQKFVAMIREFVSETSARA